MAMSHLTLSDHTVTLKGQGNEYFKALYLVKEPS